MREDLIYDVGLFDGGDTAYYLFRGYNVVAIDANPMMIEKAKTRFSKEIAAGRLTLLNVGVAREAGTLTFWVSEVADWSSFDRSIASRNGTKHRAVDVPTRPFHDILGEFGVPHYLKIDIEGHDRVCIEGLTPDTLPKYVSLESECAGESVLTEEESLSLLRLLHEKGYRRFKLVPQTNFVPVTSTNGLARLGRRVTSNIAWGKLRVPGLTPIVAKRLDPLAHRGVSYRFEPGSSGPWGEDIRGPWMSIEKAERVYIAERRAYFRRPDSQPHGVWFDWHATR